MYDLYSTTCCVVMGYFTYIIIPDSDLLQSITHPVANTRPLQLPELRTRDHLATSPTYALTNCAITSRVIQICSHKV